MDFNKQYKCSICNWKGKRTHLHHIIPLKNNGKNSIKNIIELCPNHHTESFFNEESFAKKHNLIGEALSKKEIEDLQNFSILYARMKLDNDLSQKEITKLFQLKEKYNFNEYNALSQLLGITKSKSELDFEISGITLDDIVKIKKISKKKKQLK